MKQPRPRKPGKTKVRAAKVAKKRAVKAKGLQRKWVAKTRKSY